MSHNFLATLPRIASRPSTLLPPNAGAGIDELEEISLRLHKAHGPKTLRIACLLQMTATLFASCGLSQSASGVALLAMQRECVDAWLDTRGLGADDLAAAVGGLKQGCDTALYLDGLPD